MSQTRDPAHRGWQKRNCGASHRTTEILGVWAVQRWAELTAVDEPMVSFRGT